VLSTFSSTLVSNNSSLISSLISSSHKLDFNQLGISTSSSCFLSSALISFFSTFFSSFCSFSTSEMASFSALASSASIFSSLISSSFVSLSSTIAFSSNFSSSLFSALEVSSSVFISNQDGRFSCFCSVVSSIFSSSVLGLNPIS
jgi:hypothetical protein